MVTAAVKAFARVALPLEVVVLLFQLRKELVKLGIVRAVDVVR